MKQNPQAKMWINTMWPEWPDVDCKRLCFENACEGYETMVGVLMAWGGPGGTTLVQVLGKTKIHTSKSALTNLPLSRAPGGEVPPAEGEKKQRWPLGKTKIFAKFASSFFRKWAGKAAGLA